MFLEQIATHYRASSAHQFLLHFNVQELQYDEVYGYLSTRPYLMEQLNALGCELVMGYNAIEGIIVPRANHWYANQTMLDIVPRYEEAGVSHFQSLETWRQTLRQLQGAPKGEGSHQIEREPVNASLAIGKLHEDPFATIEPAPTEELQDKFRQLLSQDDVKVGLIIDFLEQIAPNHPSLTGGANDELQRFFNQIQHWASDLSIRKRKHIILLVTQNTFDIHPKLTLNPEIPLIEIPFPNYERRLHFIQHLYAIAAENSPTRNSLGTAEEKERIARETVGVNLSGIHDIVRQAAAEQQKISDEHLQRYRTEHIKVFSHGVLEVSPVRELAHQQGPGHVNRAIQDIADGIKQGDWRRTPRGILLLGPAGTGKMYMTRLLAAKTGMTFAQLRYANQVGKVTVNISENENSYERNLSAALNFIRGIAPVVVFMEQIEQASPHTSMPAEDTQRVLPMNLVNAISDTSLHGRIIWVGATSRPDIMPPIFRRTGLFDDKLVLLPPPAEERIAMMKHYAGEEVRDSIDFRSLLGTASTDGLSGRDIFLIHQRAHNISKRNRRDTVTEDDIREAIEDFVPNHSPEMQLFMALLALREANSRAMLPDKLLPQYQEFVQGNRIDKTKINQRLLELSSLLRVNGA